MSWLKKIQNKPQEAKMHIIWTVSVIVAVLLIIVWVVSSGYHKNVTKDTKLFQSLDQGIKDVKENYGK